jgi:hypothetical protein
MSARHFGPLCAFLFLLAPTPAAGAAGLPLPSSVSGKAGAVAPGGSERLVTRRAGDDTLVRALRRGDGGVLRSRLIAGRWHVPAVTLEGATTGLSADGDVLVLARPTRVIPPSTTDLAVLDARSLRVRRHISLPGFFTVDAISPDGRWLYLIQYAGDDPRDYRVRALDTRTGLLAARDVVDPREPDEQMGGFPMTRTLSRDGRWAYTLYSGGSENFIHALDTVGRTAACIDLEMLSSTDDFSGIRLVVSRDGRTLRVRDGAGVLAIVDARTFAVREPGEAAAEPEPGETSQRTEGPRRAAASPQSAGFPWPALLAVVLVGAVAVAIVRRRALR